MKTEKSKKAMLFNISLTLLTIVVLSIAYVGIMDKKAAIAGPDVDPIFAGEVASNVIESFYNVEELMLYVDNSARYASYDALFELGEFGGLSTDLCGEIRYGTRRPNLWNIGNRTCFPSQETVNNNFVSLFRENFNNYIKEYPEKDEEEYYTFKPDTYDFYITNTSIKGIAAKNLRTSIQSGAKYYFKPSFTVDMNHHLLEYTALVDFARELVEKRITDPADIQEKIDELEAEIPDMYIIHESMGNNRHLFSVEFDDLPDLFEKKDLVVRFGLEIVPESPEQG